MIYRNATSKDAKGIAIVLKECYNIDSIGEGIEAFNLETKRGINYIIAEENNKIAGLVTLFFHGLPKHELAELDRIAVLSDYRGKGVARELFNKLIEHANKELKKHNKKLRKLFLMTHSSNKRAHKFYEKLGMKHESTLKDHFYKQEDEFVYSIFLGKN